MGRQKSQSGQALVEYLLIMMLAVTLALLMSKYFKSAVLSLWVTFGREVSAGCPGPGQCPLSADPNVR